MDAPAVPGVFLCFSIQFPCNLHRSCQEAIAKWLLVLNCPERSTTACGHFRGAGLQWLRPTQVERFGWDISRGDRGADL